MAALSAAMSGYAIWGHDVGGYQDINFSQSPPDLVMRWAQFGCFSPIMQMHRQVTRELQYPWRFGDEALVNYQFFTQLHTRLFPYLYTCAQRATATGLRIMWPLVLLHQTDVNTFTTEHTYQFGNEFLVPPMLTSNAGERDVYLPEGGWRDFGSNALHVGGQTIALTISDQSQLPLFVRGGAIVPMMLHDVPTLCDADYVDNAALTTPDDGLRFHVYPAGASSFQVFEGREASSDGDASGGTVTISASARALAVRLLAERPTTVRRDGAAVPEVPVRRTARPGSTTLQRGSWRSPSHIRAGRQRSTTDGAPRATHTAAAATNTTGEDERDGEPRQRMAPPTAT